MKKILFLLLVTVSTYAQVSTGKETKFANGIRNTGSATITDPINLVTEGADGTYGKVIPSNLPTPTATTNALDLKTTISAGAFSGFTVTDNGNGTINVSSGIAYLRATNDQYAPIIKYPLAAYNNIPLVDGITNYVTVSYNGGSPSLVLNTTGTGIDTQTNSIAIVAARVGTTVHYISLVGSNSDPNAKLRTRYLFTESIKRETGLVISTPASLKIATTAGITYSGLIRLDVPAFNTNTGSTFTQAYQNSGGTWIRTAGLTNINNTQYSNSGVLTTLGTNKYRTDFVYTLVNSPSKLYVLLGTTEYNSLSLAQAAPRPAVLPVELQQLGVIVGRVIVKKDDTVLNIASPFNTEFAAGVIPDHNELGGLNTGDYQHLTVAEKASLVAIKNLSNTIDPTTTDYVAFGDSITYGVGSTGGLTSYATLLNTRFNFRAFTNKGVSALTVKPSPSRTTLSSTIASAPATATLVTIMAGVNDWDIDNTIGDVNAVLAKSFASLDQTLSFAEAFRYNLETIKNKYPTAKIIVLTPLQTSTAWSGALKLRHFVDVEIAIANALSIPVIDTYANSGINGQASYLPDGLHPNDAGHQLVSSVVANGIISPKQAKFSDNFNNIYIDDKVKIGGDTAAEGYAVFDGFKGVNHGKIDLYNYGLTGGVPTVRIRANGSGFGGGFSYFNAIDGRYGFGTDIDNNTDKVQINGTLSISNGISGNNAVTLNQLNTKPSNSSTQNNIPITNATGNFINSSLSQNNGTLSYDSALNYFSFLQNGTEIGNIGTPFFFGGGNNFMIRTLSNLVFLTGATERARLTTGGNFLINTTTDDGTLLNVNGSAKVGSLAITTTPTTSSGTPPLLTYNATTKAVESVPYSTFASPANAVLLTGNQTVSGAKSFTNSLANPSGLFVTNASDATSAVIRVTNNSASQAGLIVKPNVSGATGLLAEPFGANTVGIKIEPAQNNPTVSNMLVLSNKLAVNGVVDTSTPLSVLRNGTEVAKISDLGIISSAQYNLTALNTAPASATATGTTGEIRVTSTHIYVCTATNTWVRSALTTW